MSSSDDQLFLLPQNKHQIPFNLFHFPSPQYPPTTDPNIDQSSEEEEQEEEEEAFDQNAFILQFPPQESISEESTAPVSLGDLKNNEYDDDGFKTPDSSDRKIPEVKQCPPAPRKPKPVKRKPPQGHVRRNLPLDLSEEVESLFPRSVLIDFNRKIKKARTENSNSTGLTLR